MRAVVQRVRWAEVEVEGCIVGRIEQGALVLLGVHHADTEADARWLAQKLAHLRFFEDEVGKLNLSVQEVGGAMLVVSNFTLYGDCRKGRRPSFTESAPMSRAKRSTASSASTYTQRASPCRRASTAQRCKYACKTTDP